MGIENETGRVVIRFGLNRDGEEEFAFSIEDVSTFEAWAGTKLVADVMHDMMMRNFGSDDEDEDDDGEQ